VLGAHDVPRELLDAAATDAWPQLVINALRERLVRGVSCLTDEFARDRVATIAWMMNDGLLSVRVAAPSRPDAIAASSIFHNKRLIFTDATGDTVSAVGSPNETYAGLVANFEELTVHMSWDDPLGYVRTHMESFEKIWGGNRDGLAVRELDQAFASQLLEASARPPRPSQAPPGSPYFDCLAIARRLPGLALLNASNAALYPHQERAVVDALDRWPVRVLLADEVGLGKTLEAGTVLAYLLGRKAVRRVLILAPKNVTRQWRDEMSQHFDLDFSIYDSGSRVFESASGRAVRLRPGHHPLGPDSPDLLIASSQLARGTSRSQDLLSGGTLPDLLLVDEAHAARVRTDIDGSRRPTLLWRMLERHAPSIPHVLLLTATPLQLEWIEYYSLLQLLGLPPAWDEMVYERSLSLLANASRPTLDEAGDAVTLIASAHAAYYPPSVPSPLDGVVDQASPAVVRAVAAQRTWESVFAALVSSHPANILTVRNSRSALERLGYAFPERSFSAPQLEVSRQVIEFYEAVAIYLREAYGLTEQAANPNRSVQLGFVKSTYFQRLASSLVAARRTLERRHTKLQAATERLEATDPGEPDDDVEAELSVPNPGEATKEAVRHSAAVERTYVKDLLGQLDRIASDDVHDPKLAHLAKAVQDYVASGDQVLVFSRYTDTVDACLATFLAGLGAAFVGHAMYTGANSWVDTGDGPVPATKDGVKRALDNGLVRVVFCSDAASEGLNLQAARVLINVDVPWNPARLEQRIGRIARLGQRASTVDIVNLWYPDSVEARMYGRLLARRDLYELAVGSLPELVSDAIRHEVTSLFDRSEQPSPLDPLERLQEVREDIQLRAIARVWDHQASSPSASTSRRERMIEVMRASLARSGVAGSVIDGRFLAGFGGREYVLRWEPGATDAVSLRHKLWELLVPAAIAPEETQFVSVEVDGAPIAIGLLRDERYCLLSDECVIDILATYLGLGPFVVPVISEWTVADRFVSAALDASARRVLALPGSGRRRIHLDGMTVDELGGAATVRIVGPLAATGVRAG
jgi:superfamily II DNA or RNA helicase